MATLNVRLTDLTTAISTILKTHKTLINGNAVDLSSLTTTQKSNLVAAINEVKASVEAAQAAAGATIDDAATASTVKTYSVTKINSTIDSKVNAAMNLAMNNAPEALDTLGELAAALNNDANFAATLTNMISSRVSTNASQGLTAQQQANARANIGAVAAADIGNTDTDFVAVLNAGLI